MPTCRAYRIAFFPSFCFLLIAGWCAGSSTPLQAGERKQGPAEAGARKAEPVEVRFLREAESRIDRVYLMTGDSLEAQLERVLFDPEPILDKAGDIARKGPEAVRARAAALMAKILRLGKAEPVAGLRLLLLALIGEDRAGAWHKEVEKYYGEAIARWDAEVKRLREAGRRGDDLPEKPSRDDAFAPLPPVATWNLANGRARSAFEAGQCLLALGRRQDALGVFKLLGEKFTENLPAVLAAEGGGDLSMQPGQYGKAVDFYEHAVKAARRIENYLHDDPHGEAKHARERIEAKLAEAKRLFDIDRYGEGYVDYRRAEILRRKDHDYLRAWLAYERLQETYPGTVYAEAAAAYQVKCLLALFLPEPLERAREALAEFAARVEENERRLRKALRDRELRKDEESCKALRARLEREKKTLDRARSVPLGGAAPRAAEARVKALLAENEYGLYRGELLCDLAEHALERRLDSEEAEKRYARAWAWLEKVERADADLAAFAVPDKARGVTAMPEEEKSFDAWGSVRRNDVSLGAVANRLTCEWYLGKLRRELRVRRGFVHVMKGRSREAKADFRALLEFDPTVTSLQRRNFPNAYKRLVEDCERGYFWGWPEDLKAFNGRRRTAAYLAGFYFEINEWQRAEAVYGRLLAGAFGEPSREERAFVLQGLGECRYMRDDLQGAAVHYETVTREFAGTPTEPKALLSLANACLQLPGRREESLAHFQALHEKFYKSEWGEKGLYYVAFVQAAEGGDRAPEALRRFLKTYPCSRYAPVARRLLAQCAPNAGRPE